MIRMLRFTSLALVSLLIAGLVHGQEPPRNEVERGVAVDTTLIDDTGRASPPADATSPAAPREQSAEKPKWIGVQLSGLDDEQRARLKLPDTARVLVGKVFDGSPAAKAGVHVNDVILKAGGQTLESPEQLVSIVMSAGTGPLEFTLIRGAEAVTVSITPGERPAEFAPRDAADVSDLLNPYGRHFDLDVQYFNPGPVVVFTHAADRFAAPLPEGMSITISKSGGQPATAIVRDGDKKWEILATAEGIKVLPNTVRARVEPLILGTPDRLTIPAAPDMRWAELQKLIRQQAPQPQRVELTAPRPRPTAPMRTKPDAAVPADVSERLKRIEAESAALRADLEKQLQQIQQTLKEQLKPQSPPQPDPLPQ